MNNLINFNSETSKSISTLTEIYTFKKPKLIEFCNNVGLKSTGKQSELRTRISKFLKGTIKTEDLADHLSSEERIALLNTSQLNKIAFKKTQKEVGTHETSSDDSTKDKNNIKPHNPFEIFNSYENIENNLLASTSKTEDLIKTAETFYSNLHQDITDTSLLINFDETTKLLSEDETDNIYEKIELNKTSDHASNNPVKEIPILKLPSILNQRKMSENAMVIKPEIFSGNEDITQFFKQYNTISRINGWDDEKKLKFLPIFVKGTASQFLDNLKNQRQNWTWGEIQELFLKDFQPIGNSTILKTKLEKRKQHDLESIFSYITEVETLCRAVDNQMKEEDICAYILKGLKENVLQFIMIHDNNNLKTLKDNLKKFEKMQFTINSREPTVNDYTNIVNEVTQISQKSKEKEEEIENLKHKIEIRDKMYEDKYRRLEDYIMNMNISGPSKPKSVNFLDNNYQETSPYREKNEYKYRENNMDKLYRRDRSLSRDELEYERQPRYRDYSSERYSNRSYDKSPNRNSRYQNYKQRNENNRYFCSTRGNGNNNYNKNFENNVYKRYQNYNRENSNERFRNNNNSGQNFYGREVNNYNSNFRSTPQENRDQNEKNYYNERYARNRTPERYNNYKREQPKCYKCNKLGHFANNCRNQKNY